MSENKIHPIPIGYNVFDGKRVYFIERGKYGVHVVGGITRYGKCNHPEGVILTTNGVLLAKDISKKDIMISLNKKNLKIEKSKVKEIFSRNYKGDMIKIRSKRGTELKVTPNHSVFVWTDEGIKEKQAQDLKIKDYLIQPVKLYFDDNKQVGIYKAALFGLLIGDGCISISNSRDNFELSVADSQVFDYFNNILKKLNFTSGRNGLSFTYRIKPKPKVRQLCKKFKLKQCKSAGKEIPQCIFTAPKKEKAEFLKALFSCDGYVHRTQPQIEYCSISKNLIYQIYYLLLCFGIISSIYEDYAICNNKKFRRYRLFISGKDNLSRFKEIGFVQDEKNRRLNNSIRSYNGNSNETTIPFINHVIKALYERCKPVTKKEHKSKRFLTIRSWIRKGKTGRNPGIDKLKEFMQYLDDRGIEDENKDLLKKLINKEIEFVPIRSIIKEDYEGKVYDFSVAPNVNYFSDGILIHNSSIVKNLYCGIGKFRRIIIFDYAGEHKYSIFPNFQSKDRIDSVPELFEISNFGFYISDFDSINDWFSMGFPEGAANEIIELARNKKLHLDDPYRFREIISKLPTVPQFLNKFNIDYPEAKLNHVIHEATKKAMMSRYNAVLRQDYFMTDEEDDKRFYINDWVKLILEKPHLYINLNLTGGQVNKARAYIGKIMRKIQHKLKLIKCALFFEEADKIFPTFESVRNAVPTSLLAGIDYVLKFQKFDVELFFIIQDLDMFNDEMWGNYHTMILGQIKTGGGNSEFNKFTKWLKWDADKNYREFVNIRRGSFFKDRFIPDDLCCLNEQVEENIKPNTGLFSLGCTNLDRSLPKN